MPRDDEQQKEQKHFTVVMERSAIAAAKVLIWALLAVAICYYFWSKYVKRLGIESPEAYEYAQIARHNMRGEWFQTDVIRPVDLWLNRSVHNHPDLYHPPAFSVVLAGLMKLNGARNQTLLWGSELFFLLLLPVVYFTSRSMFDKRTARLGLFFLLIMPALGMAAVSATPAMLACFLVTAFFALLAWIRPRRYAVTALAGLVLGVCALTATRYALLVLPAIGYLVLTLRRRAWAHVPILVGIAIVIVLPWAIRNVQLSGSPWTPMEWTSSYQLAAEGELRAAEEVRTALAAPHVIERSFSPDALQINLWGLNGLRSVFRNLRLGFTDLIHFGAQSLLVLLFFAGILIRAKDRHAEWARIALYVAIATELLYGAVARPDSFLLLAYIPLIIVWGTFALIELIQRLGYRRPIYRFALLAAAVAVATGQAIIATNPAEAFTQQDRDRFASTWYMERMFEDDLDADAVIVSNVPWHTAWYLDRPSIWLPPRYEDLMRITMQADEKIEFAFLAGYALSDADPSYDTWEAAFREQRAPDSFGLVPFHSTILALPKHVYTSFISKARLDKLLGKQRGPSESSEPSPDDTRSNGEDPVDGPQ